MHLAVRVLLEVISVVAVSNQLPVRMEGAFLLHHFLIDSPGS